MKVSLAKVFEIIDYEANIEPYNSMDKNKGVFISVNRLKVKLAGIDEVKQ